jgi:glycosyltransferase involved in cell wall biosynthesis
MRVLHVAEGARFAGIESHLMALFSAWQNDSNVTAELAVFNDGPLGERAAALGVPVHRIQRRGKYDPAAVRQLAELIRSREIAVVHTHGYLANVVAGRAMAAAPCPLVTTVHGAPEPFGGVAGMKMRLNLWLDRRVMRRQGARVVAVAEHLAARLRAAGVPGEKIVVIHNGLAAEATLPNREQARAAFGIGDGFAVAFVGRLEPVKDPALMVEVARKLTAQAPGATFLVAGDGPLLAETQAAVAASGLTEWFMFLGFVDDLGPVFAAADAYLLTSRHEGIPNAALEAMRAGVPVVAPSVGGLPELLAGLAGSLAASRTSDDLAGLLLALAEDPAARQAARQAARARFVAEFTAEKMVGRLRRVYQEATEATR